MPPPPAVFRFAPSPNGFLHLGHALSALVNARRAAEAGGRLLLRIEDIDPTRCRPEFEAAIIEDLRWLGITWEEPVRRQSAHMGTYAAALDRLQAEGLVYRTYETRSEIATAARDGSWPRDPDGGPRYVRGTLTEPEIARRETSGAPFALRLDMEAALRRTGPLSWTERDVGVVPADPAAWGDVVLGRKETPASYHLCVVLDDAAQGVTDVVRGHDLYFATAVHRVLQALLGLPAPRYEHHRLVLGPDGRKLSKSTRSTSLRELRAAGRTADDIRRMVDA